MARGAGVVTPFLIMTERKPDPSSAPWLPEVELLLKPCAGSTLLRAATSILEQRTVSRYG